MKDIDKQKLLSAIDKTIASFNKDYSAMGVSCATCIILAAKLYVVFDDQEVETACLIAYRTVTKANNGMLGFADHPGFSEYSPEETHRVRAQKLQQFHHHVLHHWKE